MPIEHIIASTKTLTVWNYYPSREAAENKLPEVKAEALKDAEKCRGNHVKYGFRDDDPDYWLKQADKYEVQAEDFRVMTWEEYHAEEANQILSRPIEEITEERFDEALNCLPPLRWGNNRGIYSFFMCEFWTGNYTHQYARIGDRYFRKLVNYRKPETWISAEMVPVTTGGN